jgi:hypothetical protein
MQLPSERRGDAIPLILAFQMAMSGKKYRKEFQRRTDNPIPRREVPETDAS